MTDESNEMSDEQLLNEELGVEEVDIVEEEQTAESTEAELAEKALESSEESAESAETKEEWVPLPKFMAKKNEARDLTIENARLAGIVEGMDKVSSKTDEVAETILSPLEKAEAEYLEENGDLDGFAMTGALYRQQQAFDKDQAAQVAVKTSTQTAQQSQNASAKAAIDEYSEEKTGPGLDYRTIVVEGEKLLTKGERLDISDATDDFGQELYKKTLNAILRKGGSRAEELQKLIAAQKSETKPEEEEDKTSTKKKVKRKTSRDEDDLDEELLKSADEAGNDELDTPSDRLTSFMFD